MVRARLLTVVAVVVFGISAVPAQAASVTVLGQPTRVFDYDTMRCANLDWPDIAPRAFRDTTGRIQLITGTGNLPNFRMVGPDFDHLTRECTPILTSSRNPLPYEYDDGEWLASTYSPDGQEVFALIHSEYHGALHAGYCGDTFIDCRYNTVTYAHSTDGGESYQQPAPPGQLVAALPYRSVPGEGRYGFFEPSNIVQKDGFFYAMLLVSAAYKEQDAGTCLMRTQDLSDPKSWRAWDGEGFNTRFIDPYRNSARAISRHVCEPISKKNLREVNRSIVWSTYLNKWVATGTERGYEPAFGENIKGFYFSLSDDLVHWTPRQLIMRVETGDSWQCGDPDPYAYPSLIDPSSTDRNFTTMDQTTHLYMIAIRRENCMVTNKRDVWRVPIEFGP